MHFVKKDLDFISKESLAAVEAIQRMQYLTGIDVRQVLSFPDWEVAIVDGQPEVMVNEMGMRRTAVFSTTPEGIPTVDFHVTYFGDVKPKAFQDHLYRFGYLMDQRRKRRDAQGNLTKCGYQHRYPTAKGSRYFQLPEGRYVANGRQRGGAVVRPDRVQELVEQLISEGLRPNPSISWFLSQPALTSFEVVDGHQIEFRRGA
ncbi:hypothetical protein ABZS71_06695 [Streptomyces sp. NPDC005393]|uniref:hypothetical protein n=1 Tax=Streptomyces sp. NPDC005393 TaxID=3157041 RepID=UPI00339DC3DD